MWRISNVNDRIQKAKIKLLDLGYLNNEWLDRYLEMLESNLNTPMNRRSTQAHHAIPVISYWNSTEPYNRQEALKLARQDTNNFEVNLTYKDHLLIHSYLTLCTDLDAAQIRYEAQAELRKSNSEKSKKARIEASIVANRAKTGTKYSKRTDKLACSDKRVTPVICIELNKSFTSIVDAATDLNIHKNSILSCLSGRTKTAGRYHWKRL